MKLPEIKHYIDTKIKSKLPVAFRGLEYRENSEMKNITVHKLIPIAKYSTEAYSVSGHYKPISTLGRPKQ